MRQKKLVLWFILILFVGFWIFYFPVWSSFRPAYIIARNNEIVRQIPNLLLVVNRQHIPLSILILPIWLWIGVTIVGIAWVVWDSRRFRRRAKTARRRGQRKRRDNNRLIRPTMQTVDGALLQIIDANTGMPETASDQLIQQSIQKQTIISGSTFGVIRDLHNDL